MNRFKYCPCCSREYTVLNPKTGHHIYPKYYFGKNGELFELCQKCHNELDNSGNWINKKFQHTKKYYRQVLNAFIRHMQVKSLTGKVV